MLPEEFMESLSTRLTWSVRNGIVEGDPAQRGTRLSFRLHSGAMYRHNVVIIYHGLKMNRGLQWCFSPKGSVPIACSKRKNAYLLVLLAHFCIIFNAAKE